MIQEFQDTTADIDGDDSIDEQRLFNKINDDELIDDNKNLLWIIAHFIEEKQWL